MGRISNLRLRLWDLALKSSFIIERERYGKQTSVTTLNVVKKQKVDQDDELLAAEAHA